jgi:iron complex transport system permease protein
VSDGALHDYQRLVRRRLILLAGLGAAMVASVCADVVTGPSNLPIADAVRAIFNPDAIGPPMSIIVWDVRMPYAAMALLVGAALALAGAEMQTTLNNPLASPFTLGMSSAAILPRWRSSSTCRFPACPPNGSFR